MLDKRISAYQKTQLWGMTPRDAEAAAFVKAAHKLKEAGDDPSDFERYVSALRFNQRLWTIVQANLVEPGSPLPADIKANLMSLSIFVDRETFRALARRSPELLDGLAVIDRHIASGLLAPPPEGAGSESGAPPGIAKAA